MSLPSSQNGVFLNNSEKTKKHLENERRILRLQQVRNESRNIARKIRNDVAAEKQRQLIRLQATKEKELELWRRSVLLNKYEDYRSAVFHIGDAHAAAQAEREAKPKVAESLFRRQMRTRQSFNKYDPRAMNKKKMEKSKLIKNNDAFTQTVISSSTQTANKENVNEADKSLHNNKRKWHTCQDTEDCLTSDESEELDSCCQASLCLKEKPELKQTGTVILEVEDTQIDGRKKQKPGEMTDNFVQTNRQFSHIVSNNNPTKKKLEKEVISTKPRFTQVSKVLEKAKANEDKSVTKILSNQDLRKTDAIQNNNNDDKENRIPRVQPIDLPSTSHKLNEGLPMKYIEAYAQEPARMQKRGTFRAPTREYIKLTQEEIQQITEERNKACQDIKRLTEKLAGLSHDFCHEKLPKKIDGSKRQKPDKAATPPQTPKKVPERIDRALSAPTSPVARRKVDRASSPHPTELQTTESAASTAVETVDRSSSPLMIKTHEIDKAPKQKTIQKNDESQVESSVDHKAPISSKKKTQKTQQISNTQQKVTTNVVLLDYAIDQSELLTRDLNRELESSNPAPNRVVELQSLLAKNESLRKQMCDIFERCRVLKFTEYDNKLLKSLISEMCKLANERDMLFKETVLEPQIPEEIKPMEETQPKPEAQPEKKEENKPMTNEECRKPVEIVITVKGATPLEGSVFNNQENLKLTLNAENKLEKVESSSAVKKPNEEDSVPKEISYDSESTHYKTLPKQIHSTVYDMSDEPTLANIESHDEDTNNNTEVSKSEAKSKNKAIIDPLIKQYVDRLLSMRRSFIRGLEISTSDVDTLSDSVLNATTNRLQRSAELNNSQRYFESAEQWITENYKFLDHLEETLTKRHSVRLEKSIKITPAKPAAEAKKLQENIDTSKKSKPTTPKKTKKIEISNKILKEDNSVFKKPEIPAKTPTIQKTLSKGPTSLKKTAENKNLSNNNKSKSLEKSQITDELNQQNTNNFSELANSCSKRIDELNNMITRVREEKQRLVENTYSSLSINSPEPATNTVENTIEEAATELPDRHAALTGSRDSGIDNSRPATRQEAIPEEPKSAATTESSKHAKPPASLKRFSPQLNEEVAIHELSTIVEVETPITSRLTTNATNEPQNKQAENTDLAKLQSDLEKELLDVLQGLRKRNNENSFAEFPSITTYLNKAEETSASLGEDVNKAYEEKVKELINCLRLSNLSIKSFPTPHEYTRRLQKSTSVEMLHTASLENISECVTEESDSDTMNIEEELRKRKLLLQPFQVEQEKDESTTAADLTGWAGSTIRRMQETNALSSGTSPSPHKTKANKHRNTFKLGMHLYSSTVSGDDDSSSDSLGGRELNLRDFLHRELSRHCNTTSGSTSSPTGPLDISLGHQFINSILDSMTPKTQTSSNTANSAPKNDTQNNLVTHKTSTPVQSGKSRSQENDTSNSTTLFSCESHVSSVPCLNKKANKNKK